MPVTLVLVLILSGCLGKEEGVESTPEAASTTTQGRINYDTDETPHSEDGLLNDSGGRVIEYGQDQVDEAVKPVPVNNFLIDDDSRVCFDGPRIIIRMYGNTTCEECIWVKSIYDKVAREYQSYGEVTPIRWELDTQDNALTKPNETEIPSSEIRLLKKYTENETIPTFILGCKYIRVGSGHYETRDAKAEEQDMRNAIRELVSYVDRRELNSITYSARGVVPLPPGGLTTITETSSTTTSTTTLTSTTTQFTTSSTSTITPPLVDGDESDVTPGVLDDIPAITPPPTPTIPEPIPYTPPPLNLPEEFFITTTLVSAPFELEG